MNIFDKRPLALILSILLAGFVAASSEEVWLRVLAISAIPLLVLFSIFKKQHRAILIVSAVSLLVSVFCSYLYFDFWFYTEKRFKEDVKIQAEIIQLSQSEYGYKMLFDTDNIDSAPFTNYTLLCYISREEAAPLSTGDVISFNACISGFEDSEDFNTRRYYASDGVNAKAEITSEITILSHRENIFNHFAKIREDLRRRAVMQSDEHNGNLVSALLLGERDSLSGQVRRDFKYIGISHTLALSGMHLSVLVLGLSKLLMLIGVGRRARDVLSIAFTLCYLVFTGLSVSIMRAGFMLIVALLLRLIHRGSDALTSLIVAVFIICIITPYAIFDSSLWLSAFATLGLVVLSEYSQIEKPGGKKSGGRLNWLKLMLLSSVFAISVTILFSALGFGSISLVSPLSTLIFSPLIELIMYIGTFMLIFGSILPIGALLSPICHLTEWLAGSLASIKCVYLSTDFVIVKIFIAILFILTLSFMLFNIKNKSRHVALLSIFFVLTLSVAFIQNSVETRRETVSFESSTTSSFFLLKSEGEVGLISSAVHSGSEEYMIAASLEKSHISTVDKFYVTHYSFGLPYYLEAILKRCDVRQIILPTPRSSDEEALLKLVRNTLYDYRITVTFNENNEQIALGSLKITPIYSSRFDQDVRCAYNIDKDGNTVTYLSSGMLMDDVRSLSEQHLLKTDIAVLGSTGVKYQNNVYMDTPYPSLNKLIISSKKVYLTQSVKRYYISTGSEVIMHPEKIELL
ncbi:MAG: ComEC/Rec2 family competence protein [Clostridia bacterium]|nr:ComEC/Rec2 family competence protein [Clostridia bacterium]